MDNLSSLLFMRRGGETRRYHGFRMLQEDTVGHHTFNLLSILIHICPDASATLLRAALKHDVAEHIVGDMPAPTKRATCFGEGFREQFGRHEADVAAQAGLDLEEDALTPEEKRFLKLADAMDGMMFCIDERALGNQRVSHVFIAFASYVDSLLPPVGRAATPEGFLFGRLWSEWNNVNR